MNSSDLDTKSAPNAFYAARDARMRNFANSTLYSESAKIRAERMKLGLELVYRSNGFYLNFRLKFITIKIENPSVRDRVTLDLLESDYEKEGITKVVTAQAVIYRITKQ